MAIAFKTPDPKVYGTRKLTDCKRRQRETLRALLEKLPGIRNDDAKLAKVQERIDRLTQSLWGIVDHRHVARLVDEALHPEQMAEIDRIDGILCDDHKVRVSVSKWTLLDSRGCSVGVNYTNLVAPDHGKLAGTVAAELRRVAAELTAMAARLEG